MKALRALRIAAVLLVVAAAVELPVAYFVNLKYYDLRPRGQIPPRITGTFIQYTGIATWNYTMWDAELADLKALGLDTIVLQWAHDAATVDKIVIFDVPHYLSEQQGPQALALHDAYEAYLATDL
jgi:hypothetical protein